MDVLIFTLRRYNENDVTMTIAGLWRYGDWRHVATGCTALVLFTHWQVVPGSRNNIRQLQNDNLTKLRFIYKLFFSKMPRSSKITILIMKIYKKSKSLKI